MKNQKSVLLQIPLILFLLTLGWGCTRNNANKTQISLDLGGLYRGKASAQSLTERVVKVAINVHGGPQLATAGWESCHCLPDDQVELPPNIFTLPVSEGTGRLIQVLIVTETMTGKTYFSYGDKLTNIVKGDNIVEISVNTSMQSENSAEAGIRYIRSDGSGPSGVIDLLYRPSSDKPSMLVHSMSAVGGWMRIHLFETTKVDYRLRETGEVLFAGVNFSHSDFLPSSRMLHVRNPIFFADKNHTGSPPYEAMPASELFFGFAGPGA
ncbi:MAG: hypothetical protein KDD35_12055, partial [Bdellovibrionales bacterium]|nr:hypothetical protein [Bdellovibrionales bacterium]